MRPRLMDGVALAKRFVRQLVPPVCENVNSATHDKACLLLYITKPFRSAAEDLSHQNRWQVREVARIVGSFGYNVDVIDWYGTRARLRRNYDLIIDVRPGSNDAYHDRLNEGGRRVALLTTSNPSVSNRAEMERLDGVFRRTGIRLQPRWQMPPIPAASLESCDAVWLMGNQFTLHSYAEFRLPPVRLIPNTGYPVLFNEDQSGKSPTSFLFLGSVGQVHKGLDILLEVFTKRPSLQLFVCGHFAKESDFCRAYRRELFTTGNIVPLGFLDIRSDRFREVARRCSFVVMPSCAEGMSGSVLTGMSAGLVPIVSRECGLSGDGVHLFADCSINGVADAVDQLSCRAPSWIAQECGAATQLVRDRYSPEHFSAALAEAMTRLMVGGSETAAMPPQ